jgi:GNAT superfamily N-acetyltransferase
MLRICLDAVPHNIYSRSVYIGHCTELQSWPDYAAPEGLTIRTAGEDDLAGLAHRVPPSSLHRLRARLREGQTMLIALAEGEIAGYAWICASAEGAAAKAHLLDLKQGEALHWDSVTFEEFRRQGVYTELQKFSRAYLKGRGYARVYGAANTRNPAPVKMMKKLGLKPVHLRHTMRILGRKRQWLEPIPPDFQV